MDIIRNGSKPSATIAGLFHRQRAGIALRGPDSSPRLGGSHIRAGAYGMAYASARPDADYRALWRVQR